MGWVGKFMWTLCVMGALGILVMGSIDLSALIIMGHFAKSISM